MKYQEVIWWTGSELTKVVGPFTIKLGLVETPEPKSVWNPITKDFDPQFSLMMEIKGETALSGLWWVSDSDLVVYGPDTQDWIRDNYKVVNLLQAGRTMIFIMGSQLVVATVRSKTISSLNKPVDATFAVKAYSAVPLWFRWSRFVARIRAI